MVKLTKSAQKSYDKSMEKVGRGGKKPQDYTGKNTGPFSKKKSHSKTELKEAAKHMKMHGG